VRPSRLVLENFGPYRERAEVDFSLLEPLFLVCGKTGSGKTSLFDAITYALYGAAPGSRSGLERQLWSQHARPGDIPLVEFEFSLGGADYRAVRSPPYRRSSKRGKEGLVEVDANAAFYRRRAESSGWELVADKKTEVDEAVRKLVGLTVDEFSKIILLPQGEFQRFLDMKSSDRVEVLEKLFPVSVHEAVSSIAKEKTKDALAELRRVELALERLGGAAEAEAAEKALRELQAEAVRLVSERDRAMERLQAAQLAYSRAKEAAEREARAVAARERLAGLEAEAPAAAMRERRIVAARAAALVAPAIAARGVAAADLEASRVALAEQRSRLELLAGRIPEIEAARARVVVLAAEAAAAEREIGELRAAQEAWAEARRLRGELEDSRALAASLANRAGTAREAEAAALASRDAAAVGAEEEEGIRRAFEEDRAVSEKASAASKAAEAAAGLAAKALRHRSAAVGAEAVAAAAALDLERAEEELSPLEAADRGDMAARLALGLRPGEPCPVCGSREHAAPARAVDGAPNAEELAAARAAVEAARAALAVAKAAAVAAADRASETERELLEPGHAELGSGGLVDAERFESRLSEARKNAALAAETVSASAKRLREMEERRKDAARLSAALEAARARRVAEEAEEHRVAVEVAKLETKLESALAGAGIEDPGPKAVEAETRRERALSERGRLEGSVADWEADRHGTEARVAELSARVASLVERLASAEREEAAALSGAGFEGAAEAKVAALGAAELAALEAEAAEYRSELDAAAATAAALEAEIAAASRSDVRAVAGSDAADLEATVEAARTERDKSQTALDAAVASVSELERERSERVSLEREREGLRAEWSRLNGLSALLCGEMPGRKLPFKNYVLGSYFRVVAERASARLSLMSDGRYSLAADEGEGRGYLGLELLVRDSHTGQSRPAGTLSGGERFMAALSLAFGLADTIRERSGGASLDAIFIDEGFGSLDDEALDRAVTVLDEARGARTVGIVSHVAELKARIPSRIEVSKARSGSSLRITN
jgi:DNA repair protein SbcC/Rad50